MISIEKANLIAALKKVMPGVEKGATVIDGADQLLFTGASVSSYNGEIAVSAPCDTQNVSFSVKGADFYNLVSRMSDVMISLEIVDNKVKLKAGRTKASMTLLDSSKVLELVKDLNLASLEYKPLSEDFVDGVRICALAGNIEAIRGVAVGDCGDTSAIFETDTNRVCINKLPEQMESFWVDDGTFNDALKVGTPKEYSVSDAWLHLKYEDGTVFSAKRKDHSAYPFPVLAGFLDSFKEAKVVLSGRLPSNISEAVSRVAILASGSENKNARLVELTFNKDELDLYAVKSGGEASESIPWETPLEEDPQGIKVWVDTAFLLEASNKVMDFTLCYLDMHDGQPASLSLVFQSGDYTQFVSAAKKS